MGRKSAATETDRGSTENKEQNRSEIHEKVQHTFLRLGIGPKTIQILSDRGVGVPLLQRLMILEIDIHVLHRGLRVPVQAGGMLLSLKELTL
jgi:hypothetical protein